MYYIPAIIIPAMLFLLFIFLLKRVAIWKLIISTILIYFALMSAFYFPVNREKVYVFDSDRWKENKNERWRMESDLLENRILEHKDSNQVKQLLGQPDHRNGALNQWTYNMGQGGGGLGFLFHALLLTYDKGQVKTIQHSEFK